MKHFGYEFRYDNNNVDKEKPLKQRIPPLCVRLVNKLLELGHLTQRPDQLTVNQYLPGQGLTLHYLTVI